MEPEPIGQLDLYLLLREWVRPRLSWFPRWTFDDILHEAFIVALEKLDGFDPQKGTRWTYLNPRLFDPLWTKYMHLEGYRIDRERTREKWMRRRPVRVVITMGRLPEAQADPEPGSHPGSHSGSHQIPARWSSPAAQDLAGLLMRGLTAAQAARARGVSQSAASQMIRKMRRDCLERPQDAP